MILLGTQHRIWTRLELILRFYDSMKCHVALKYPELQGQGDRGELNICNAADTVLAMSHFVY